MKNSCIITGKPGCGKTHLFARVYNSETDLAFTFTNKAKDVLISRNVHVQTFDSFFIPAISIRKQIERIKKWVEIAGRWYLYMKSDIIKALCDCNLVQLQYKFTR